MATHWTQLPCPIGARIYARDNAPKVLTSGEVPGVMQPDASSLYLPPDVAALAGLSWEKQPALRPVDWTSLQPLRPQQRDAVYWLLSYPYGGLVADPPGGGKTRIAVVAASALRGHRLIFGPALSFGVWRAELAKYNQSIHDVREQVLPSDVTDSWCFVSYEAAPRCRSPIVKNTRFVAVIYDEIHRLKNRRGHRYRAVWGSVTRPNCLRIGLSATPLWNRLEDLWTALTLVRGRWFGNYWEFTRRYCGAYRGPYGWCLGRPTNTQELQQRLSYSILRRTQEEVGIELPPVRRQLVSFVAKGLPQGWELADVLSAVHGDRKLQGLLTAHMLRVTPEKIAWLPEILQPYRSCGVLVVVDTLQSVDACTATLRDAGWENVGTVTGALSAVRRAERIQTLVDEGGGRAVICATRQSVVESIDCSMLDVLVVLDTPWTVEETVQLEGRLQRPGRKGVATALYITASNGVDMRIIELLLEKLEERESAFGRDAQGEQMREVLRPKRRVLDALGFAPAAQADGT